MTVIKVPTAVALSPENGKDLRLDTDTQTFSDSSGNKWTIDDLTPSRESNKLRAWLDENYPLTDGDTDNE